ncbi:PAAR-like domain-containing protein [Phaeovulum sp.]|uniref:PAAR-like domain-containing protein n=1 Tax=Phaeovulum sp. TaxID=2934796 RepID=UPI0039E2ADF3
MTVFANKLEVSCQAQANKILAAFPDVCMTPPEAPPTPPGVPIPYPNFGMDSDTDKGTGTVKIGGKTVNQKNISYFTKTTGDEAGAAAKKGVISSKNTGKSYSQAFSMNVKAEGENLTRFSDISTNNHGSPPNVVPWPKIGAPHMPGGVDPCEGDKKDADEACGDQAGIDAACKKAALDLKVGERGNIMGTRDGYNTTIPVMGSSFRDNADLIEMADTAQLDPCLAALACVLPKKGSENQCPCPGQTGHHMVPASAFYNNGRGEGTIEPGDFPIDICPSPNPVPSDYKAPPGYKATSAPCVCAEGCSNTTGSHGMMHTEMSAFISENAAEGVEIPIMGSTPGKQELPSLTYEEMRDEAIRSHAVIFPCSNCSEACLKAQLDSYHCDQLGMKPDQPLRADKCGKGSAEEGPARVYASLRSSWLSG